MGGRQDGGMGGDGGAREGWGGSAEGDTEAAEQPPGWRLEEIREIKGQRGWRGAGPDGDGEYSTERGQAGWKMGVEDGLGAARVPDSSFVLRFATEIANPATACVRASERASRQNGAPRPEPEAGAASPRAVLPPPPRPPRLRRPHSKKPAPGGPAAAPAGSEAHFFSGGGDRGGDEHGQADGEGGRGGERLPTVRPQQPPRPTQGPLKSLLNGARLDDPIMLLLRCCHLYQQYRVLC